MSICVYNISSANHNYPKLYWCHHNHRHGLNWSDEANTCANFKQNRAYFQRPSESFSVVIIHSVTIDSRICCEAKNQSSKKKILSKIWQQNGWYAVHLNVSKCGNSLKAFRLCTSFFSYKIKSTHNKCACALCNVHGAFQRWRAHSYMQSTTKRAKMTNYNARENGTESVHTEAEDAEAHNRIYFG